MATYIALLRKDPKSDFGVEFPDFPGCVTAGKTLEDAKNSAIEALSLHIEGMLEDGELIPAPSSLDEVMATAFNEQAVAFLVDVPEQAETVKRINVTMPEDVINAIDRITKNRSRFLAQAAREKLNRL